MQFFKTAVINNKLTKKSAFLGADFFTSLNSGDLTAACRANNRRIFYSSNMAESAFSFHVCHSTSQGTIFVPAEDLPVSVQALRQALHLVSVD
jgi:hypothetical protein